MSQTSLVYPEMGSWPKEGRGAPHPQSSWSIAFFGKKNLYINVHPQNNRLFQRANIQIVICLTVTSASDRQATIYYKNLSLTVTKMTSLVTCLPVSSMIDNKMTIYHYTVCKTALTLGTDQAIPVIIHNNNNNDRLTAFDPGQPG